jgi:hypothetical protein
MKLQLILRAKRIDACNRYDLHRIYTMSSDGRITEIGCEPGTSKKIHLDANNIEFDADNVWLRDLKTGNQLKALDACCIIGFDVIDPEGTVSSIEHSIGYVWCSECTFSDGDDSFSFESDVARNMWAYILDVFEMYSDPLRERYVEEIECAAYEAFVDYAPSFVPDREDFRILRALAYFYPSATKKPGTQI